MFPCVEIQKLLHINYINNDINVANKWKWWDGNEEGHFGQSAWSRCRETETVPGFSGRRPLQMRVLLESDRNGKQVENRDKKVKGSEWMNLASSCVSVAVVNTNDTQGYFSQFR